MRRFWVFLGVVALITILATSTYLGFHSAPQQATLTPEAPPTVRVAACNVSQSVTAPGSVVNGREVKIEMPVAGKLAEVLVRAGDSVQAGQMLARVEGKERYQAALAAAQLEVQQAQAELDALYANAPAEAAQASLDLIEARETLAKAQGAQENLEALSGQYAYLDILKARLAVKKESLENARTYFKYFQWNRVDNPRRAEAWLKLVEAEKAYAEAAAAARWAEAHPEQTEMPAAEARLALAQARVELAEDKWEKLKEGPDALKVALGEAKLAAAQAKRVTAQDDLAQLEIVAPFAGVIVEANVRPGETLQAATSLFTLNDPLAVEVATTVIEEDIPYVAVGQRTEVYFDALPDKVIGGVVSRIVPKRASGDRPLYSVYIALDDVPARLFAGMSADASVMIAERQGVLCLPRSLAQTAADGTATVEVWAGGEKQKRVVEVGLRGDANVEILSGLKEGELVVAR